jgi:flavin-dependent dehydrogenase
VPLTAPYEATDIWLSDRYPGGYAWLFPQGRVANLGVGAERALQPNLKQPLEALHAELASAGRVGREVLRRTGGAIPVGGLRVRLVEGRALFVGDAAGLTHPISGAGIAAAVISGERAGWAAAGFLAGEGRALEEFEEDIRDHFAVVLHRAVARRRALRSCWRTPAARSDSVMRWGWIAFEEYYAA